jgi:hypothetical protein
VVELESAPPSELPLLDVPLDQRPVVQADTPPPPVSGGTLALTADGIFAVVADSDRDRIVFVDFREQRVAREILLTAGDEPGRVVAGPGQQAFVALRRAGAVVTVDPDHGLIARRQACATPRGIVYSADTDELHVACADGKLVTFVGPESEPSRVLNLDIDLRDVLLRDGKRLVSRFRSAELLEVDADGRTIGRLKPPSLSGTVRLPERRDAGSSLGEGTFDPAVAWRTVQSPNGSIHMLHQRGQRDPIVLTGSGESGRDGEFEPEATPYGGGSDSQQQGCSGIVRSGLTEFTSDGRVLSYRTIAAPLLVDVAISAAGHVAMASAGAVDLGTPAQDGDRDAGASFGNGGAGVLWIPHLFDAEKDDAGAAPTDSEELVSADDCPGTDVLLQEPVVAVAFSSDDGDLLLAQTRSPSRLYLISTEHGIRTQIDLGGSAVTDTAHDLFHRSPPGSIVACASCHPEGTDDGRVWVFAELGPRRTQGLNVGLAGTAPFHWDGALPGVGDLMNVVFVKRMGGVRESTERLQALESWLFGLKPLPPRRSAQDSGVARGRDLFFSETVGCSSCHSGVSFTNNQNYDVGTTQYGRKLQVPGLVGVGYRSPLMHDGCAKTLRERFDPTCGGGDQHGVTSTLSAEDLDALVAYLETL